MDNTWQQIIGLTNQHLVRLDQDNIEQDSAQKHLIHPSISNNLTELLKKAKQAGLEISIVSSFRSFDRQLSIWNEKWRGYRPVFSRHGRPLNLQAMSDIEKYKAICLWSALPGLSRHHWGTDLDIFLKSAIDNGHNVELVPEEFEQGAVCDELNQWLDDNLSLYGFFRPYKIYQQGVSAEPWHISHRQVSTEIIQQFPYRECLKVLQDSDICSAEFIHNRYEHYCDQYFRNICL